MLLPVLAIVATLQAPAAQEPVDPAIRAAVERFYATQEAEQIDAYLALWSKTAQRPRVEQLKYIFDLGDDKFSDLIITRVTESHDRIAVRVSVTRDRTNAGARRPDGSPIVSHSVTLASLTYVREGGELKLVREGSVVDGLAEALIGAATPDERTRLIDAEPELVGVPLVLSLARTADVWVQSLQYRPRAADLRADARDRAPGRQRQARRGGAAEHRQREVFPAQLRRRPGGLRPAGCDRTRGGQRFGPRERAPRRRDGQVLDLRIYTRACGVSGSAHDPGTAEGGDRPGDDPHQHRERAVCAGRLCRRDRGLPAQPRPLPQCRRHERRSARARRARAIPCRARRLRGRSGILRGCARGGPRAPESADAGHGSSKHRRNPPAPRQPRSGASPVRPEPRPLRIHEGSPQRGTCVAGHRVGRSHGRTVLRGGAGVRQEQRGLHGCRRRRVRRPRGCRPGVRAVVAGALSRGDRDLSEGGRRVHGAENARGSGARAGRIVAGAARQQGCARRARRRGTCPSRGRRDWPR